MIHSRPGHRTCRKNQTLSYRSSARKGLAERYQHGIHFLNTSSSELELYMAIRHTRKPSAEVDLGSAPPLVLYKLCLPVLTYNETLISFYERTICATSTFVDNLKDNPYRAIMMRMALHSEAILDALQAISARILSLRDKTYVELAFTYHVKTHRHLALIIDRISAGENSMHEACALCVLLCWFEVCYDYTFAQIV